MATVLIVEDNVHQLRLLSMWITRNGHETVEAVNGKEAQSVVLRSGSGEGSTGGQGIVTDLIITDANMPEVDGVDFVRWVRKERRWGVPILMLSSRCDQQMLSEELREYDVSILPKPFSPTRLMAEIERLLGCTEGWAPAVPVRPEVP